MALSYVDTEGTLVIPGAAASWSVAPSASGTSTTGVLVLVGEADEGPDYSTDDVTLNGYGPNQRAAVVAKYGSGRLVDAYIQATKPSKDAAVRGAPQRIYLIKTNQGTAATHTMASSYATLDAKLEGADGNLISFEVRVHSDTAKRTLVISRKLDSVSESFVIGGNSAITITAPSATTALAFTINGSGLTSAGNAQAGALNIAFSQFRTIRDLAAYISAQSGWSATAVPAYGQRNPSVLDRGTYTVHNGTTLTPQSVRQDAYEFVTAVNGSRLVKVRAASAPTAGVPAVAAAAFLAGGLRGTSDDADFIAAFAQAERVKGNFVVPLVSRNAASDTDTTSTYTIAGVNAALADHVARMSQFKMKKPRQGFASILDTYANQKAAAQNMAYARVSMCFLNVLATGKSGLAWFQPWMGAVTAAAMQAAAFYKPIFGKALNISGIKHDSGSAQFTVENPDMLEDALQAGLLPMSERDGGGFEFTSDQTTYGVDDNFVLNSIQAIYCADTISMTVATKMEKAFKGQNFADVSAGVAMSYFKSVMGELRRLKLVKGTAQVPAGYKDALIDIKPPAMLVSAEVKEATGLYFLPIKFLITQSEESASA